MQVSEKTLGKWRSVLEKGDNQTLAKDLDMTEESVSRILNGKQETTSDILLKIKDFYKRKKALQRQIETD